MPNLQGVSGGVDLEEISVSATNAGVVTVSADGESTTRSIANSYDAGNTAGYNSGYSAGNTAGYNSGYGQGVTDADNRANPSSTNYKTGYNSGYSAGASDARPVLPISLSGQFQTHCYDYSNPEDYAVDTNSSNYFSMTIPGYSRINIKSNSNCSASYNNNVLSISYSGSSHNRWSVDTHNYYSWSISLELIP